ncbi:YidB family protein [Falsiroseomonas oryzae]|uniref:YidB family protein n=1 Tax=Falsiroseomonas oryzae TaxID=2766473 RepID=UPI0022EAAA9E|nr:YidB family protein [Roseomonas sp. MO-31]
MARGTPSLLALLGVLAVAGYQNRDKLAEMLGGAGARRPAGPPGEAGRLGGVQTGGIGGTLTEGLRDLVDRFRQSGHGETAESWVRQGPNRECDAAQLEAAIGAETLDALSRQTGLSREEICARLSRELPTAVDRYTPEGRLPDA